jgi:hypothetical protein
MTNTFEEATQMMSRTILATLCAGSAAVALSAAPSTTAQQQSPQQPNQQQPMKQNEGKSATLTGCVYQASDQPAMFALRRTADGASSSSAEAGASQKQPSSQSTAGTSGTTGASSADQKADGAWYRLSPKGAEDLKQYAGRAVRVTGTIVPGKDPKGADIIIHRIDPSKTVVTAIDLKPAPQLQIESIAPMSGEQCPATPNAKG